MEGVDVDAEQRYAEAERIAARMGFHPAFARAVAAEGTAAELARARTRAARTAAGRAPGRPDTGTPAARGGGRAGRRWWNLGRPVWRVHREAPVGRS